MTSGQTVISVCLITYNHAKYIREAIEGVLMQTTTYAWELIIADDFSTDETVEILLQYKEKYPENIRLILQKENVGPANNFRQLLTAAKSKYIAYLEGDDFWSDTKKLQKQVDYLEANPDYGICFTDADVLYEETGKIIKSFDKTNRKRIPSGDALIRIVYYNPYKSCTVIFRNINLELFFLELEKTGFKIGDWPLWIYFAEFSKISYLNFSSATYRIRSGSASNFVSFALQNKFYKTFDDITDYYCKKHNLPNTKFMQQMRHIRRLLSHVRGQLRK